MTHAHGLHSGFEAAFRRWLGKGELRVARCAECGAALSYSARRCSEHDAGIAWTPASGMARLRCWTVYRQRHQTQGDKAHGEQPEPPYVVAQLELAEGPRLVLRLPSADASRLRIGMPWKLVVDTSGRLQAEAVQESNT